MTLHLGYFHWKCSVLNLLREETHRTDDKGPMLNSDEVAMMDRAFRLGATPEFFVQLLVARDSLSRDTSIGAP